MWPLHVCSGRLTKTTLRVARVAIAMVAFDSDFAKGEIRGAIGALGALETPATLSSGNVNSKSQLQKRRKFDGWRRRSIYSRPGGGPMPDALELPEWDIGTRFGGPDVPGLAQLPAG